MLEAVGIAPEEETAYRQLLHHPDSTVGDLAGQLGEPAEAVARRVSRLEQLGLVSRSVERPGRYRPVRPDVAVEALVARRRAELDRARSAAQDLVTEMRAPEGLRPESVVEVLSGGPAIASRFDQLIRSVREELLIMDRPPYVAGARETDPVVQDRMAGGAHVYVIYSAESLEHGLGTEEAYRAAEVGERSRVHSDVPMKLAVADRSVALLPLSLDAPGEAALVVRSSALLDALQRMFWLLWEQGVPVVPGPEGVDPVGGDVDPRLLTMLAAGLKDESIARHLGVSSRTVSRRVADLLDRLGVRTRFQAGVYAQRRRLLGTAAHDPADDPALRDDVHEDHGQQGHEV